MKRWMMIVVGTVASLFIAFVWPTMYRYDHQSFSGRYGPPDETNVVIVRTNRFTGKAQRLGVNGWIYCSPPPATQPWEPPEVSAKRDENRKGISIEDLPERDAAKPDQIGIEHKQKIDPLGLDKPSESSKPSIFDTGSKNP